MLTWSLGITMLAMSMGCERGDSSSGSRTEGTEVRQAPSTPRQPAPKMFDVVRCTDGGIAVDGDTMTASADGVHLEVTNTIGEDAYLVASPVQENPTMTIPPGTSTVVALTPPGEVRLQCGAGRDRLDRSATVTVEDPHGFYRSVNVAEALGCKPDSTVDSHEAGWGSTAREAAEAFAAQLGTEVKVTEGNGYRDHDRKEFLLHVDGQGWGTLDAYPDVDPNLVKRYRASYKDVCTERVFRASRSGD